MITQPAHKYCHFVFTITVLAMLSACGSQSTYERRPSQRPPPVASPAPLQPSIGERATRIALQQIGTPYRYGGSTRGGFDCSGLMQYSYLRAGKAIARTTGQQWSTMIPVARRDLRKGDLLFFSIAGKMSHVGLYIGAQEFVHAPSTGRSVEIESLSSPFYARAFIRAGRPR